MESQTLIRRYETKDKSILIDLLRINTPKYFGIEEEIDFLQYLESEIESYFIIEKNQQIVGCGGINLNLEKHFGIISWGMIHPDFFGQKLGSQLLEYRISFLKNNYNLQKIIVRTSQLVFPFYQKHGFELKEIHPGFWSKGIDMYLMEMELRQ
jgi:N-acetylglutamate synthase-like GNAT family acetyltransferase